MANMAGICARATTLFGWGGAVPGRISKCRCVKRAMNINVSHGMWRAITTHMNGNARTPKVTNTPLLSVELASKLIGGFVAEAKTTLHQTMMFTTRHCHRSVQDQEDHNHTR